MRDFGDGREYLAAFRLDAQHHVNLLGHDDDADGRQHPVHHRGWKIGIQPARFQQSHENLQEAGHENGRQGVAITGHGVACPQRLHGGEDHHDQPCRRAVDRHIRPADPGHNHPADERRDDPAHRRESGGHGNTQTQGQGNQKNQEAGGQVRSPVFQQSQEAVLRGRGRQCRF